MTLFDKEKRERLDYAKKIALKSGISIRPDNCYNSFSKISQEEKVRTGRIVANPLLNR